MNINTVLGGMIVTVRVIQTNGSLSPKLEIILISEQLSVIRVS